MCIKRRIILKIILIIIVVVVTPVIGVAIGRLEMNEKHAEVVANRASRPYRVFRRQIISVRDIVTTGATGIFRLLRLLHLLLPVGSHRQAMLFHLQHRKAI